MSESDFTPENVAILTRPPQHERKFLVPPLPQVEYKKPAEDPYVRKIVGERIVRVDTRDNSFSVGERSKSGIYSDRLLDLEKEEDQRLAEEIRVELENAEVFDLKNPQHRELTENKPPENDEVERLNIETQGREHVVTNPETGEEVRRIPTVEGAAGTMSDPLPAEVNDEPKARNWVEDQIRILEQGDKVDPTALQSLLGTIQGSIKPETFPMPIPPALPTPPEFKVELLKKVRARIGLHNAALDAQFYGKEFPGEFMKIQPLEHIEIFKTEGVQVALEKLMEDKTGGGEGEFFRLASVIPATGATPAEDRRVEIINGIMISLGGPSPENEKKAKLALDLGEKVYHAWGESSYYDGIRVAPGTVFTRNGVPVPGIVLGNQNWISHEVVETLYPDPPAPAEPLSLDERYARFFVEFWDNIDKTSSFSGQGAAQIRQTLWYPILLEKPGTKNKGEATYLRRYAHLRISSFARYQSADVGPAANLLEAIDYSGGPQGFARFKREFRKVYAWAPAVGSAFENRTQLNDKGKESVLNSPFVKPNDVTERNAEKLLPKALENFLKAAAVYQHLPFEEQQRALAHLYQGMQEFMNGANNKESRKPPFSYYGWNSAIKMDALSLLADEEILTRLDVSQLFKAGKISTSKAGGISAGGEALEGIGKFLNQITRIFKLEI